MYVKERVNNHFLNLLGDKELARLYFYNRDIVEEFNSNKLIELEKNVKKSENRYNKFFNIYSLVNFLGIESLVEKVTKSLAKTQKIYSKSENELDTFKSNLAYLIISGNLKLEAAKVLGYSKEFIEEFLVSYKYQADNPYNEYYYNEKNGRTTMIDKEGFNLILPDTPDAVLRKIAEKESEEHTNDGLSSLKRLSRR